MEGEVVAEELPDISQKGEAENWGLEQMWREITLAVLNHTKSKAVRTRKSESALTL